MAGVPLQRSDAYTILAYLTLIIISVFCLLPFIWMALTSVDSNAKLFLKWPDSITFDHYTKVFAEENGVRWFANSLFTVLNATILVVIISGLGGYALSRSRAWWKQPFLYAILLIRVLPVHGALGATLQGPADRQ